MASAEQVQGLVDFLDTLVEKATDLQESLEAIQGLADEDEDTSSETADARVQWAALKSVFNAAPSFDA